MSPMLPSEYVREIPEDRYEDARGDTDVGVDVGVVRGSDDLEARQALLAPSRESQGASQRRRELLGLA